MPDEQAKAFVRRQIDELWNRGNLDLAEECFTQDFVGHDPASPAGVHGPEGFKQNVATTWTSFPDFRVEIVDQVAEGDRVVTRYVTTGTQQGEVEGLPPDRQAGRGGWDGHRLLPRGQDLRVVGVLRRYGHDAATGHDGRARPTATCTHAGPSSEEVAY